jgi:dipeptidyl aminopeptidase/acylaminoacyl peptidase
MSDEGSVGGDIFLIPATGGQTQNLTLERKTSASWLTWTRDGKIVAGEYKQGESSIISLDPATAKIESLYAGADQVTVGAWNVSVSASADGKVSAAVRSSFAAPPEVGPVPVSLKQITRRNEDVSTPEPSQTHLPSDSFQVQGWLIIPRISILQRNINGCGSPRRSGRGRTVPLAQQRRFRYGAASGYFVCCKSRSSFGNGEDSPAQRA